MYATDPIGELVAGLRDKGRKIDLLINISASPFQMDKEYVKHDIFKGVCTNNNIPLIYVNQVGGQDSLLFDGWSLVMDCEGRIIARAERFKEDMVVVDTASWQGEMHDQQIQEIYTKEPMPDKTINRFREIKTVYDALVMGVKDYAAKCGFSNGHNG